MVREIWQSVDLAECSATHWRPNHHFGRNSKTIMAKVWANRFWLTYCEVYFAALYHSIKLHDISTTIVNAAYSRQN